MCAKHVQSPSLRLLGSRVNGLCNGVEYAMNDMIYTMLCVLNTSSLPRSGYWGQGVNGLWSGVQHGWYDIYYVMCAKHVQSPSLRLLGSRVNGLCNGVEYNMDGMIYTILCVLNMQEHR